MMGVSAPSFGLRGALGPPMSVLTKPGQQALIKTSSAPGEKRRFLSRESKENNVAIANFSETKSLKKYYFTSVPAPN